MSVYGSVQGIIPPLGPKIEEGEINYPSLYVSATITATPQVAKEALGDVSSALYLATNQLVVKPAADDVAAFLVEQADGTDVFAVDTVNAKAILTGALELSGALISTPDAITATSETVAASLTTIVTEITTNSDADGDGCIMVYTSDGWNVVGNNGGTLA